MKTVRCIGGMGDVLAMSGGAVWLARQQGNHAFVYLPMYEASVLEIFAQHPEVKLIRTHEALKKTQSLGCIPESLAFNLEYEDTDRDGFDKDSFQFYYHRAGIPYEARWDWSPVCEASRLVKQIEPPKGEYVFIHDDTTRGMRIDIGERSVYRPSSFGRTILAYKDVLENALEVHVMDPAFFHLAEQLEPKGKLFFHQNAKGAYRSPDNDYLTKHRWEIVT